MTAVFDDHDTSDDMDTELHLDYPVLPPQQSLDDHNFVPLITVQHQILQRKKTIYTTIDHLQNQTPQLGCTLTHTTTVPFRFSCKTLDTSYVHKQSSPSLLATIQPGYSRSTPDPKHRGVAMSHTLKSLWLLVEKAEMDDLIKRKVWLVVKRSSLKLDDHIFSTRFHYKIKRKNGAFERCKVRLVVEDQDM
jgi:hypothetical protein